MTDTPEPDTPRVPQDGDRVVSRDGGNVVGVISNIDGTAYVVGLTPLDESHTVVVPDDKEGESDAH